MNRFIVPWIHTDACRSGSHALRLLAVLICCTLNAPAQSTPREGTQALHSVFVPLICWVRKCRRRVGTITEVKTHLVSGSAASGAASRPRTRTCGYLSSQSTGKRCLGGLLR